MNNSKLIYGYHAVNMALIYQGSNIQHLYYDSSREDKRIHEILSKAKILNISPKPLTKTQLKDWGVAHHQGVIAELKNAPHFTESDILEIIAQAQNPLIVILDGVQDPHNLGACMRSALALGADAIVVPQDKACGITETVRKVACGAAEVLPFTQVKNLARFMKSLKDIGIWCVGTSLDTDTSLQSIELTGPIALVMGAEFRGLRALTEKNCDYLVKIPLVSTIQSLNVSVATGICLYEVSRQRFSNTC